MVRVPMMARAMALARPFTSVAGSVRSTRWSMSVVVGGTILLTVLALAYVARFGSDVPNTDEWDYTSQVAGAWPASSWFFEHHNEHRYPLSRLLWLSAVRWAGDYRAGMVLTVLLLAASSFMLIDAARYLRGPWSIGDLVIPALLLNWGHAFNFLMSYQVAFSLLAVGLAGVVWSASRGWLHGMGFFAAITVSCGGYGLAAAGPLVLAFLILGWRVTWIMLFWALGILAYAGWCIATLPAPSRPPETNTILGIVTELAVGWGMWVGRQSMTVWWLSAAGALTVLSLALICLRRLPLVLMTGLLAGLGTALLAAAAVGYGRGVAAIGDRFVTPSALGLAIAWVALGQRIPRSCLFLAIAIVGLNVLPGYRYGVLCHTQVAALEADIDRGTSPVYLAGKHGGGLPFLNAERMTQGLLNLRNLGWNRFRSIIDDPACTTRPAHAEFPVTLICSERTIRKQEPLPILPIADPEGRVIGLRIRGEQLHPVGHQLLRLRWIDETGMAQSDEATARVVPGSFVVVFRVSGRVTRVQLEPATWSPGLRIDAGEWLVAD